MERSQWVKIELSENFSIYFIIGQTLLKTNVNGDDYCEYFSKLSNQIFSYTSNGLAIPWITRDLNGSAWPSDSHFFSL